jgi:Holliday junction DNA helicase RuvA
MIAYLKGTFTEKTPTYLVVEAGGIGYQVTISLHTFSALHALEEGKVLVHYHVSVDVRSGESKHQLYGFIDEFERQMFRLLISISGISSSIAMMIMSSFKAVDLQTIILTGDVKTLTSVKGVGPKVAQKIVHELREKVAKDDIILDEGQSGGNTMRQEALSALTALGFDRGGSAKVINDLLKKEPAPSNVETLIKQALKQL